MATTTTRRRSVRRPGFVSVADLKAAARVPELGDGREEVAEAARRLKAVIGMIANHGPRVLDLVAFDLAEVRASLVKLADRLDDARAYDHAHIEEWAELRNTA